MHSAGSEFVVVAEGTSPPRAAPSAGESPSPSPSWVLVAPATVAATRTVLARYDPPAGSAPPEVRVIGWADLSAPNLVDLLDDLRAGPGGSRLAAIAVRASETGGGWLDDLAVRRGLGCLRRAGLSLRLVGPHPAEVVAGLVRLEPGLVVVTDATTGPAPGTPTATG